MNSASSGALPIGRQPVLRVIAAPAQNNPTGEIFGGWLMSQVDIAGSIAAIAEGAGRVVTKAITSFVFHKPLFVGELISIYAEVVNWGNTSVTVDIACYSQRQSHPEQAQRVADARIVYVAVDADRKPRPHKV